MWFLPWHWFASTSEIEAAVDELMPPIYFRPAQAELDRLRKALGENAARANVPLQMDGRNTSFVYGGLTREAYDDEQLVIDTVRSVPVHYSKCLSGSPIADSDTPCYCVPPVRSFTVTISDAQGNVVAGPMPWEEFAFPPHPDDADPPIIAKAT